MKDVRKTFWIRRFWLVTLRKLLEKHLNSLTSEGVEIDENTSDWYHTFKELYDHRIALFIRLVIESNHHWEYDWRKSFHHADWTDMPWWFIVQWYINWKQISYHLPIDKRDLVDCPTGKMDERDWHTSDDVVQRLLW